MEGYGIKFGDRILIRGKISRAIGNDCIAINPLKNNYEILEIYVRMNDDIQELEEGKVIVIEAEFMEDLAGLFTNMGNGKIISK